MEKNETEVSPEQIREYNWEDDTPNRPISILVDGIRNSGKSYMMEKVLPQYIKKNDIKKVILISGTGKIQDIFKFVKKNDRYEPSFPSSSYLLVKTDGGGG